MWKLAKVKIVVFSIMIYYTFLTNLVGKVKKKIFLIGSKKSVSEEDWGWQ